MLLKIEDLWVKVNDKLVLKGVNLEVHEGEVHVLLGPNAIGKTTLLMTIMGLPKCKVIKGRIIFKGTDITTMPPHERAKLGIALAFQMPPKVNVKLSHLINEICKKYKQPLTEVNKIIDEFRIGNLINRDLFDGFSGGEVKRTELLITFLQRPSLVLLDEPDSGVDIESLSLVGNLINKFIDMGTAILLVTHLGAILKHLKKINIAHVMLNGSISYSGDPYKLLNLLSNVGYSGLEKMISKGEIIE